MANFLLISFICILNIILWCVFLSKFKKLFSTNDIRIELNRMISDMNKSTSQDLQLIEGRISELRELLSIADKKIATVKMEAEKSVALEAFTNKIDSVVSEKKEPSLPPQVQNAYVKNVPVYSMPKVTVADKPLEVKKPLNTTIHELHTAGLSVEEIAHKIGKSTTEVSMVIDMGL